VTESKRSSKEQSSTSAPSGVFTRSQPFTTGDPMKAPQPNRRLFAIRNTTTNRLLDDEFFDSKMHAKARRDELNNGSNKFVVTHGPDHWKKNEGETNGQNEPYNQNA
jgi:hypothetical protein